MDFGCGYGGKTVDYARYARSAAGIEPFWAQIDLAAAYARHVGSGSKFRVCTQECIPYDDASFDIVLSHDVLEHVDDPSVSLSEIARVLRPDGEALILFPPYDGMFSHHLDYASLLPGLHWLFPPAALVAAVNALRSVTGMAEQPVPKKSWDQSRNVLPGLNGLTGRQFEALANERFRNVSISYRLVGFDRGGLAAFIRNAALAPLSLLFRDQMAQCIVAQLSGPRR